MPKPYLVPGSHPGFALMLVAVLMAVITAVSAAESGAVGSTKGGNYAVRAYPQTPPVRIAELHNWILHIETLDGVIFVPRQLVVSGGMPGHGHGLPSEPTVSRYLGNGDYLVEGMKFNMAGNWQLIVDVTGPLGPDRATLEFVVADPGLPDDERADSWSPAEVQLMKSLTLERLPNAGPDRSNRFSGMPLAAEMGERLFNDQRLSASGTVSCASCHKPDRAFADDKRFSVGTAATRHNAPGLLGASHQKWFYWDGRRDSLWSQALTPIETPGEMDNTRVDVVRFVLQDAEYRSMLAKLGGTVIEPADVQRFPAGAGPFADEAGKQRWWSMRPADQDAVNRVFTDIGKVLAAYQEGLEHAPSRFDRYVAMLDAGDREAANTLFDAEERQGLKLFLDVGKTLCLRCHNGPLFTNFGFHNIGSGVSDDGHVDFGRMLGLQAALVDEFNCQGRYSDANPADCKEMRFATEEESAQGAFKVPGLRDVAITGPYLHDGRFSSLTDVIRFYTEEADPDIAPREIPAVSLTAVEIDQLVAFLGTLTGEQLQ